MRDLNRRSFLATSAFAGLAPKVLGANDRIQLGIVGTGGRGQYLARAFDKLGCRIAAVCDVWERRRKLGSELYQCEGYLDYRELLQRKDIDAVAVATPDHWHATVSIAAMESGKDVYCEKPMCHTIDEARRMMETARKTSRIVQVGSNGGSAPQYHSARKAIAEGRIGRLVMTQAMIHRNNPNGEWNWKIWPDTGPDGKGENFIHWKQFLGPAPARPWSPERYFRFRKFWDYSGGIATDLFYHSVAPFNLMWGEPQFPRTVTASGGIYGDFPDREVPDTFHMVAEYSRGHSMVLTSTMCNAHGGPTFVRGELGTLLFERKGGSAATLAPEENRLDQAYRDKWGSGEMILPMDTAGSEYAHMQNFMDCVRTRSKPNTDVVTGACAQVAITMAVESYRQARVLQFDPETWTVKPAEAPKITWQA